MNQFLELNLNAVHATIDKCALLAKRDPNQITLLAVSKTVEVANVERMAKLGQINFGENYVQEGVEKIKEIKARGNVSDLIWHFIGPLQSNKTKQVAENFDWVQTIDRLKIAQRLSDQRPPNLKPLQLCIQVNIDGGLTKSGISANNALELAKEINELPKTVLRGIMTIPDPVEDSEQQLHTHRAAQVLFESIRQGLNSKNFDTLSMGMSADIETAIAAGSTMVRVGTALFGARQ